MNHPDITFYGTDPDAQRRRMVRDLELFLDNALATGTAEAGEHREHDGESAHAVYSPTATAMLEDLRC